METTNILLIVLICICYIGFGIRFLKHEIHDRHKKDEPKISFLSKIIMFLFWWLLDPLLVFFAKAKDI